MTDKQSKTFTAAAIGVVVPKTFCALLQKMVQEINLTKNTEKVTFVDLAMSYAGSPLHKEYGKALFKHQQYTQDHNVERLSGLSSNNMTNFPLLNIPGVTALHTTNQTITSDLWQIITKNDLQIATHIDDYLHQHYTTHLYNPPPQPL